MHARRTLALAVLAPLVLGACGAPGRGKPSAHATGNPAPRSTPTVFAAKPSPTPTPTATASGPATSSPQPAATTSGGGGNAVQGTAANTFEPAKLTVKAGTEVMWALTGFHSVTGGKDGKPDPASPMKSEIGVPAYKVTFAKAGTYPYFCQPHYSLGMVGEILVT